MKISQKQLSLIGVAVIAILTVFKLGLFDYSPERYRGIDSYEIISIPTDSLDREANQVRQHADALKWEKERLMSGFEVDESFTFISFGVAKLSFLAPYQAKNGYYINFPCLGLPQENYPMRSPVDYWLKDGQPLLVKQEMKQMKNKNILTNTFVKVDYYYSAGKNMLFIPVHSVFWRMMAYFSGLILSVGVLSLYLFILFTFFKFILAVAKNEVFTEANIQRLRDLSICFIVLAFYQHVLNLLIYLLFSLTHNAESIIITHSLSMPEYLAIVFAILSYLMYTAFKKAFALQRENDLTI